MFVGQVIGKKFEIKMKKTTIFCKAKLGKALDREVCQVPDRLLC
jgi:hypothetical protein